MDLSELIEISRYYGQGSDFAIPGGGNTSVKDEEHLAIKASGAGLKGITEAGFVELSRAAVRKILTRPYSADPFEREAEIKADLMASRTDPAAGGRPSVETSLHELIGWRFVVHTHPHIINALTCSQNGETAARELFGVEALWVPYTDPGYRLAKLVEEKLAAYRSAHRGDPRIVLMQNHGLVVAADTIAEIRKLTDDVVRKISARFRAPVPREDRPVAAAVVRVLPALRMLLADPGRVKVVVARNSALAEHFLQPENRPGVALPFMPDNIVYCRSAPLVLELGDDPEQLLRDFPAARAAYRPAGDTTRRSC